MSSSQLAIRPTLTAVDAFALARSYFPGKILKRQGECLCADGGQDQPVDLSAVGTRKGVEVGPLVSLVDLDQRPLTYRAPYLAHDRLETQAVLVLAPQLYLCRWVALLEPQYPHRELFLKASCSALLAFL